MIEIMPPFLLYHSRNTIEVSFQTKLVPTACFLGKIFIKHFTIGEVAYELPQYKQKWQNVSIGHGCPCFQLK